MKIIYGKYVQGVEKRLVTEYPSPFYEVEGNCLHVGQPQMS